MLQYCTIPLIHDKRTGRLQLLKHAAPNSFFEDLNSRLFYEYRHCDSYFCREAADDTYSRNGLFIKCMALSTAIAAGGLMLSARPMDNISFRDVLPGLIPMVRPYSLPDAETTTTDTSEQAGPAKLSSPAVKTKEQRESNKIERAKAAPSAAVPKRARRASVPARHNVPLSMEHKQIASAICSVNGRLQRSEANMYAEHIIDASERFSINPAIVTGVMLIESRGNRYAVSKLGAVGLMQVMWDIHGNTLKRKFPEIEDRSDMFEARNSIMAGTWILKGHLERNNNDLSTALSKYLGIRSSYYHNKVLAYAGLAGYNK